MLLAAPVAATFPIYESFICSGAIVDAMQMYFVPLPKGTYFDDFITLEDKFIFIKGKATTFRRINREEAFFRPLDTVSKRELYDAIYKIINHLSSIDQETLIKMILLSLGYKKMKKEDYDTLIECIEFLLKSKIIFNDGTTLYRDIEIEQ